MTPSVGTTVEDWLAGWLRGDRLAERLRPGTPPSKWSTAPEPADPRPTRPDGLRVADRTARSVRVSWLKSEAGRARVLHTFCHHEVQAAELFAWAILRFPETDPEFRAGLLTLWADELRHARLYERELERLGSRYGAHPVRDWFWDRVPEAATPLGFVAFLGLGLEGGNLEHARRFAAEFRAVGDKSGARVQEQVAREEEAHVRFAARWFSRWTGCLDFDAWQRELPEPLTPMLMRGRPLARDARRRAGLDDAFLDALEAWPCGPSGS